MCRCDCWSAAPEVWTLLKHSHLHLERDFEWRTLAEQAGGVDEDVVEDGGDVDDHTRECNMVMVFYYQ